MRSGNEPRAKSKRHVRAKATAKPQPSPAFAVTLALLFLLPVLFTPGLLVEEFELAKVSLLVTGALVLAAWWIAAEGSRVGAAGFAGWLGAIPGRAAAAIRRDPLGGAVALMLLSAGASTVASVRAPLSLFGAPQSQAGLRTVAALVAVYYASRALAANPAWFRRLAQAAGAAAAVAAAYSLLQIAHLDPFTWQRQSTFEGMVRSGSTVGHANTLSAYLAMCLPLVAWLAVKSRSRAKIAWLALAAVSAFIIVASLSRGAWLGVAAGGAVAILLVLASGRRPTRGTVLIAGAVLALALLIPLLTPMRGPVLTRVGQITDVSAATSRTRVELWRAGLRMFANHPVLGVGLDSYIAAFPPYRTASVTRIEWGGTPAKAHNDAVQILATQGLLGGVAALAIVILCAIAVWRTARHGNPDSREAAIVAGASLAAFVASSLVGFGTVAVSALAAALAGWAARASVTGEESAHHEAAPARSRWNLLVGAALASVLWFFLVGKPLRAEMYLAQALHYPAGNPGRDELLANAADVAPWDPRYPAELGRSFFYEALRAQDDQARVSLIERAHDALAKSVRIAPENGENRVLFATIVSAQSVMRPGPNTKNDVREEFQRAVERDPLSPVVLVGAERGLIAAGLLEDARVLALRCVTAYPDYAPPLADLGSMALEQGRTAAAAETLGLAVRLSWREDGAGAANAWNDLARANLVLQRYRDAEVAADSALARNPNLGQAFALKTAAHQALEGKGPGKGPAKPAGGVLR